MNRHLNASHYSGPWKGPEDGSTCYPIPPAWCPHPVYQSDVRLLALAVLQDESAAPGLIDEAQQELAAKSEGKDWVSRDELIGFVRDVCSDGTSASDDFRKAAKLGSRLGLLVRIALRHHLIDTES
jgi:hypothetical protein